MSNETASPFTKPPSWKAVFSLLGYLSPFIAATVLLWLGKEFATHTEIKLAVDDVRSAILPIDGIPARVGANEKALAPLAGMPARVQSIEEFRLRQERAQEKAEIKFESIQQSLATISAQQTGTNEKLNRLLDTLERMNRRSSTP